MSLSEVQNPVIYLYIILLVISLSLTFQVSCVLGVQVTSHFFFFNNSSHFTLPCLLYLVFLQLGKLFQVWKSFFHSLSPH